MMDCVFYLQFLHLKSPVKEDKFICSFGGEGEPVPEGKENTGGVYVQIYINCPEYLNLQKANREV